jgi:hypothetical protein
MIGFTACPKAPLGDLLTPPAHCFVFKNKGENSDFFIGNSTYNVDSIVYTNRVGYIGKFEVAKLATENRFAWGDLASPVIYIDYKNGDIDTIKQVSIPTEPSGSIPKWDRLDNLKVYFNGQLVKEFDFLANPNLRSEYRASNSGPSIGTKNPMVIELSKK